MYIKTQNKKIRHKHLYGQWLSLIKIFQIIYKELPTSFLKKMTRFLANLRPLNKKYFKLLQNITNYLCIFIPFFKMLPTIAIAIKTIRRN